MQLEVISRYIECVVRLPSQQNWADVAQLSLTLIETRGSAQRPD